jgi:multidrug efflux pump
MKVVDRFVDKPLPIFLLGGLVVFLGLWCLEDLPVKRTPKIEIPYSLVVVPYVGAAPADVETEVTIEVEDKLNGLDDLRHSYSVSRQGVSTVFLEFEDRTDMKESQRDVRTKVDLARAEFPVDADFPIVQEISFDDIPIIFFAVTGSSDGYRLREIAEELEPSLEAVPGVSRVEIFGGFEREIRIQADPAELAEFDLTLTELADIVASQSRSLPAGQLRGAAARRMISATGEFASLEELRSIAITREGGMPISLGDLASVELSHKRLESGAWSDGAPSASLIVRRRPDVDTLETVLLLKARVAELAKGLPEGIKVSISSDSSREIDAMVRQLGLSALFGVVLVVGVLLLVFGFRQALLVACVLPFSLLFTFIGLRVFGMEISNVALFALVLVLGLVVDGAIIVGEAIFVERESGESPRNAAKIGISRVGFPVIAADLTTIAAFLPMLLMVGIMGQFMSVIPKVVVFALVGSIFVDHFLLPAASAKLKKTAHAPRVPVAPDGLPWISPELPRIRAGYHRALTRALEHRWSVVATAVVALILALGVVASGAVQTIFLPTVDRGRFVVNYALPLGTPIAETNRVGALIMADVAAIEEVRSYTLTTGNTGALNGDSREGGKQGAEYGKISIDLVEKGERLRHQSEIVADLRSRMAVYAGVDIDVEELTEGPPVGSALAVRIKGDDLTDLVSTVERIEPVIAGIHGALDVRVDYEASHPEVRVEIDRPRAKSEFGVTPNQVSRAMLAGFEGVEVGRMWIRGQRVDLRLGAPGGFGQSVDAVRELPLRVRDGSLVPLGELANVDLAFAENAIYRHDGIRTITLRAGVEEGFSTVAFEDDVRSRLAELTIPAGIRLEFGGESEERDRSNSSLIDALKWGLLAIYIVIAIQFNSVRQPFIVLITIPLSLIGVVLGLIVTGYPFSFLVFIGIVSLTGIVVNDGIVMVDGINQKRRSGMSVRDAILGAAVARLRPVILTTVTTIAGLLPLTLNIADGGEFWIPLGVAIISGLLVASTLTLFVVPVLYSLLERDPERRPRVEPRLHAVDRQEPMRPSRASSAAALGRKDEVGVPGGGA